MHGKTVLFDMDGVILDSEPLHYRAAREVFAMHGYALTYKDYRRYFGGQTDRGGFGQYCAYIGALTELEALLAEKALAYQRVAASVEFTPCPGALETIAWLTRAGAKLALVTGSLRAEAELVLEAFELQQAFAVVVAAEDVAEGKPHPAGYLRGSAALGAYPTECLVVEDAPSGIQAAKTAGIRCLAVTTTYAASDLQGAALIVDRLHPDHLMTLAAMPMTAA